MKYQNEIHSYIQSNKEKIIEDLIELVKIPSVSIKGTKEQPFGNDCAKMLEYVSKLFERNGFETLLNQEGGYTVSYYGDKEKRIGIFSHADVVPASDDWLYTKPFEPIIKEGNLIARGTRDDKCGIVIALYIAKIFRDLNIPLKHGLEMFTGVNEESGMEDIKNYIRNNTPPVLSVIPDMCFPCYNGDKGIYRFWAHSSSRLVDIVEIDGGEAFNIVLGEVRAKIKYSKELFDELKGLSSNEFIVDTDGKFIFAKAIGVSKHAASPFGSKNALFILCQKLTSVKSLSDSDKNEIEKIKEMLYGYDGEAFGIVSTDEKFGQLTCASGMIKTKNSKLSVSFDIRFGISADFNKIKKNIVDYLSTKCFTYEEVMYSPAFLLDENDELVKETLNAYKEFTGCDNPKSLLNEGATYAKYLPRALEIGKETISNLPCDLPEGHGSAHEPDEMINIDGFLNAIELIAQIILRIDNIE